MKKNKPIFLCLLALSITSATVCQTLEAQYKVTRDIFLPQEDGSQKLLTTLDLKGLLFKKDNRYISYCKPLYLEKYPLGRIDVNIAENNIHSVSLFSDSLQGMEYADFDSLIKRTRHSRAGSGSMSGTNNVRKFDRGAFDWEFLPDTKIVNGLKCQKATLFFTSTGKIGVTAWFCPDIKTEFNVRAIHNLPGLVVEMDYHAVQERWVLEKYTIGTTIEDSLFWPAEFNQPFKELPPIKRRANTKPAEKSDAEKRREISNQ